MSKQPRRSAKAADSYRRRKPLDLFPRPGGQPAARSAERIVPQARLATPPAPNPDERVTCLVQLGIEALQTRRLDDAAGYLESAIAASPSHALAYNCLGLVRRATGDTAGAIACYEQAVRWQPDYAEAYNNLGVALESSRELERAVRAYEAALARKPNSAAVLNNLGNALTKLGRAHDAVIRLREALVLQPGFSVVHNNLGLALNRLGQDIDAERCFRQALEYQPVFPEAQVNLGHLYRAHSRLAAAAECYRAAVEARPHYAAAWASLGHVLFDQHDREGAAQALERALLADPRCAEAHFGRGNLLLDREQLTDAIASFRQALEHNPEYAEAWNNLGSAYRAMGQLEESEAAFAAAVRHDPDLVAAHNNLGNLYRLQERPEQAANAYREVIRRKPDMPLAQLRLTTLCPAVFARREAMAGYYATALREWHALRATYTYRDLPDLLTVANEAPYNLQFFAEDIRLLKEAYAAIFQYGGPAFRPWSPQGRIRIGCVVTAGHEVAFLRLIWDTLRRMNRDEFEVTILCAVDVMGKFRQAIAESETPIVGIPEQAQRVLPAIRDQRFDLLYYFEIGTDARNYFLPYFRLAPVQVTSWGIQVTSGIPEVDYYLSSGLVEGPAADSHYSETLIRARTILSYQTPIPAEGSGKTREGFGFSPHDNLYLCAQHLGKFHPDFDEVLAAILRRDPRGKIVGTEDKYGFGARVLRERWQRTMPDVASRVVLLPRLSQPDYTSLLAAGDVMLDPIHFGGVSTTYDGLSLDKPIVTLPSAFHRGRYTAGCLQRLGVTHSIARDQDNYVQIAVSLGRDRSLSRQISSVIHENRHQLFEDHEAVSEHERIFRDLVARGPKS
ncbi:MAG: tetratricopeptide repeat protein [Pirellulaceae bacterium]